MNIDIRLDLSFYDSPKTKKLIRRLGYEGVICLQKIWIWAAEHEPLGVLKDLDTEDIELIADWSGEEGELVNTLALLGWLDNQDGTYSLHNWQERQSYASKTEERHEAARKAVNARWEKKRQEEAQNKDRATDTDSIRNEYTTNTQSIRNEYATDTSAIHQNTKTPIHQDNNILKKQEREPQKSSVEKQVSSLLQEYASFVAEFQQSTLQAQPGIAPKVTDALIRQGAQEIDKAIRLDGLVFEEIKAALEWARQDSFWSPNVLSLAQIRRKGGNGISKLQTIVGQYRKAKQQRSSPVPPRDSPHYESRYEREQREMRESYQETMRILGMIDGNKNKQQGNTDEQERTDFIDVDAV